MAPLPATPATPHRPLEPSPARRWLRHRQDRAAEGRAVGLERAPVALPAGAGLEVTRALSQLDGLPQRLDLVLGGEQVGLVGLVADHLAGPGTEVDQLEHPRHDAPGAP